MSFINNQQRTVDGINTISADVINVVEQLEVDGYSGTIGQFLKKNLITNKLEWNNITLSDEATAGNLIDFNGKIINVDLTEALITDVEAFLEKVFTLLSTTTTLTSDNYFITYKDVGGLKSFDIVDYDNILSLSKLSSLISTATNTTGWNIIINETITGSATKNIIDIRTISDDETVGGNLINKFFTIKQGWDSDYYYNYFILTNQWSNANIFISTQSTHRTTGADDTKLQLMYVNRNEEAEFIYTEKNNFIWYDTTDGVKRLLEIKCNGTPSIDMYPPAIDGAEITPIFKLMNETNKFNSDNIGLINLYNYTNDFNIMKINPYNSRFTIHSNTRTFSPFATYGDSDIMIKLDGQPPTDNDALLMVRNNKENQSNSNKNKIFGCFNHKVVIFNQNQVGSNAIDYDSTVGTLIEFDILNMASHFRAFGVSVNEAFIKFDQTNGGRTFELFGNDTHLNIPTTKFYGNNIKFQRGDGHDDRPYFNYINATSILNGFDAYGVEMYSNDFLNRTMTFMNTNVGGGQPIFKIDNQNENIEMYARESNTNPIFKLDHAGNSGGSLLISDTSGNEIVRFHCNNADRYTEFKNANDSGYHRQLIINQSTGTSIFENTDGRAMLNINENGNIKFGETNTVNNIDIIKIDTDVRTTDFLQSINGTASLFTIEHSTKTCRFFNNGNTSTLLHIDNQNDSIKKENNSAIVVEEYDGINETQKYFETQSGTNKLLMTIDHKNNTFTFSFINPTTGTNYNCFTLNAGGALPYLEIAGRFGATLLKVDLTKTEGTIGCLSMPNLPTSGVGGTAGDIYNDSGTLKIV